VSVLLRQPNGFEGGLLVLIEPVPNELAVAQPPDRRAARIDLDAVPSSQVSAIGDYNVFSSVDERLGTSISSKRSSHSSQKRLISPTPR
jgi:hypothetical protein